MKAEEIITDQAIEIVWGNANFGDTPKRDVIGNAVLKCASGYSTGNTAKSIVVELGLVTGDWKLTKLGKEYLYAAHSGRYSI